MNATGHGVTQCTVVGTPEQIIEKFNSGQAVTAVHFDGGSRNYYVKRFHIETTTTGRRFGFISEDRGSKLVLISVGDNPLLEFNYRTKRGEKKSRKENLVDFVEVKGWKALGNKLGNYLRMSGFQLLEEKKVENSDLDEESEVELTLFN